MSIRENLQLVQGQIEEAAQRAGRNASDILLIGVSKTQPVEAIREAFEAGLRHFGENRVQEWEGKSAKLSDVGATWHLIGHLQSNKAARAVKLFQSVDSVDDESLARRLDRFAADSGGKGKLRVLVEVHLGGEESKSGVPEEQLPSLAESLLGSENLEFAGLMCVPPYLENSDEVRPYFARLRQLRDKLEAQFRIKLPVLSMGMSHDFEAAILEGATEVRVGTALFGARPPLK